MTGQEPIYRALYRELREAIIAGVLAPGERLRPTRALAAERGVSRNTVLEAYEQLIADGLVVAKGGSGTFVNEVLQHPGGTRTHRSGYVPMPRSALARRLADWGSYRRDMSVDSQSFAVCDFAYGDIDPRLFPAQAWQRALSAAHRGPDAFSRKSTDSRGYPALRRALASYLTVSRRLRCSADQIVVCHGSQQALYLVAMLVLDSGDKVLIEDPCYQGARLVFQLAGARLVPTRVDDDGIRIASAYSQDARLAYVTPSHQFPSGATLSIERRTQLLSWAERTNAYIFEDDYDSELKYASRPLTPLQALDSAGRVLYCGTLSKLLHDGLRLGYLVAPEHLVEEIARLRFAIDRSPELFSQIALAEFIRSGDFTRHVARLRRVFRKRRNAVTQSLQSGLGNLASWVDSQAGQHLLVRLSGWRRADYDHLIARAADAGVGVYSAARYYHDEATNPGLLLGFTRASQDEIRAGVRVLSELVQD